MKGNKKIKDNNLLIRDFNHLLIKSKRKICLKNQMERKGLNNLIRPLVNKNIFKKNRFKHK